MIVQVNCVKHHLSWRQQDLYALPPDPIKHPCNPITAYAQHSSSYDVHNIGRDRVKWSISSPTRCGGIPHYNEDHSPIATDYLLCA